MKKSINYILGGLIGGALVFIIMSVFLKIQKRKMEKQQAAAVAQAIKEEEKDKEGETVSDDPTPEEGAV